MKIILILVAHALQFYLCEDCIGYITLICIGCKHTIMRKEGLLWLMNLIFQIFMRLKAI